MAAAGIHGICRGGCGSDAGGTIDTPISQRSMREEGELSRMTGLTYKVGFTLWTKTVRVEVVTGM